MASDEVTSYVPIPFAEMSRERTLTILPPAPGLRLVDIEPDGEGTRCRWIREPMRVGGAIELQIEAPQTEADFLRCLEAWARASGHEAVAHVKRNASGMCAVAAEPMTDDAFAAMVDGWDAETRRRVYRYLYRLGERM